MNRLPLYILLTAVTAACGSNLNKDIPVPRRTAYHRLDIPAPAYTLRPSGGFTLQLNNSIDSIESSRQGWITARYPDNMATLYITISNLSGTDARETIDNRVERLSLNTGGEPTEVKSFTTLSGLDARLIVTPSGSPTPVQFIATDHKTILMSGSAMVQEATSAAADSIAPIIEMLERDITHMLKTFIPK